MCVSCKNQLKQYEKWGGCFGKAGKKYLYLRIMPLSVKKNIIKFRLLLKLCNISVYNFLQDSLLPVAD